MIQRIQTLYLILTIVLSILFLSDGIIVFSDGTLFKLTGIHFPGNAQAVTYWLFTAVLLVIPLLACIIIFLYRNRKLQLRLSAFLILLIVVMAGLAFLQITNITDASDASLLIKPKLFYPLLMIVLVLLAIRGISKDEALVKSYDRLR